MWYRDTIPIGIPRVDGLSTGPSRFGASHKWSQIMIEEYQMYLHLLVIGVEGEVVQGSIEEVLHHKQ